MACMTFNCQCGYMAFGNDYEITCPKCGAEVLGDFDE